MRTKVFISMPALLILACGAASSYLLPDPIELAKRFGELEVLAKNASPTARDELVSVCASKDGRVQFKRFAYRLLSRVATRDDLERLPPEDQSDELWLCRRLAEMRVTARKNGESKAAIAAQLLRFYYDLSTAVDSSTGPERVMCGIEKNIVAQEIGFQIADQQLQTTFFPSELTDYSPEVALYRLRTRFAGVRNTGERARLIGRELDTENTYYREAAVALMIELGESAVTTVIDTLRNNILCSNPPPFGQETRVFSSCLVILAGIGGTRAEAVLKEYSKSEFSYVANSARAFLRWTEAGVKYPAQYQRLFAHPYICE